MIEFYYPVCDIELINEIESIKRERESRVYQKKKNRKGVLKVSSSSWKKEKEGGERKKKKNHEKVLTSIIPDTRFPFKSPGHRGITAWNMLLTLSTNYLDD